MNEKRELIRLALTHLGRSTQNQIVMERERATVHGLTLAAIVTRNPTDDLLEIDSTIGNLWIEADLPKLGVER